MLTLGFPRGVDGKADEDGDGDSEDGIDSVDNGGKESACFWDKKC